MQDKSNFDKFKLALISLCKEHRMDISASYMDSLQIWPLDDGKEPLECYDLEDMTNDVSDLVEDFGLPVDVKAAVTINP